MEEVLKRLNARIEEEVRSVEKERSRGERMALVKLEEWQDKKVIKIKRALYESSERLEDLTWEKRNKYKL